MTPEDKADLRGDIQRATESDQDRDAAAGIVRKCQYCGETKYWDSAHDYWKCGSQVGAQDHVRSSECRRRQRMQIEADFQSLTTCRDHWKTSFEHERANVIRLRSLLAAAHGAACQCSDCHITRFKNGESQPPTGANQPTDTERMDALEMLCEAYGSSGVHEGNRWVIDGPFADLRTAADQLLKRRQK